MGGEVRLERLLWLPNLIGYLRLGLFLLGVWEWSEDGGGGEWSFLVCYGLAALLDCVDGPAARCLGQVSAFGSWLDVVVDVVQRGWLWTVVWRRWGYLVACLEWLTFSATSEEGSEWKQKSRSSLVLWPGLCALVAARGFASPLGRFALVSVHALPLLLFVHQFLILPATLEVTVMVGIAVATAGRCLAGAVEVSIIATHVRQLLSQ